MDTLRFTLRSATLASRDGTLMGRRFLASLEHVSFQHSLTWKQKYPSGWRGRRVHRGTVLNCPILEIPLGKLLPFSL